MSRRLAGLLVQLEHEADNREAFAELCRVCADELGMDGAGLNVIVAGRSQGSLGASDVRSALLEDLQFSTGVGPCLDAYATSTVISEPALASTSRWPGFSATAAEHGVGAVFAFPLRSGRARFGALDLYRVEPGPLDGGVAEVAVEVAHAVTTRLLGFLAGAPPGSLPGALDDLVDTAVHQAAGMVSVQLDVSIEDALLALRARAYASGSTVRALAALVIDRQLRFDDGA